MLLLVHKRIVVDHNNRKRGVMVPIGKVKGADLVDYLVVCGIIADVFLGMLLDFIKLVFMYQ